MTALEKRILAGVYELREELLRRDWQASDGAIRLAIEKARLGLVSVYATPWTAGYDAAGRQAVSRAYSALEAKGLLERHGAAGRTSHLALTSAGEKAAAELGGGQGDES